MIREFMVCFVEALKLGLTSFGGPVAHVGYFREVYVERLAWLKEERFAELMSLTQFLPGPASSQLGAAIGYERGGWMGAFGAWLGFTLPSALVMVAFAVGMGGLQELLGSGWLDGLKLAAVAVVAVALVGMWRALCPRLTEGMMAVVAVALLMWVSQLWMQPVVILLGGVIGAFLWKRGAGDGAGDVKKPLHQASGGKLSGGKSFGGLIVALAVLLALFSVPWVFSENNDVEGVSGLLRAGALVFGGGHVVLPLLESSTVDTGWVAKDSFLAGYGAAQVVPGPLFTFGGFLGADMKLFGSAWLGGAVGTAALFLPGMVLLAGGLPVWNRLKHFAWARAAVRGANATVVGVLGAALIGMVTGGSVAGAQDGAAILVIALCIHFKWLPVWAVVILSAAAGGFFL